MATKGKQVARRPYQSERRSRQAAQTRDEILNAAEELFAERGYTAVSVDEVARRAGVASATIYASGGKRELVTQVVERGITLGGPRPVGADPEGREAADFDDPHELVRFHVNNVRAFKKRGARAQRVLWRAAAADPEVAEVWARFLERLQFGQRTVTKRLEELGALRPGLDARTAADILQAVARPEAYDALVVDRGWSLDRWTAYFEEFIERQLLA